MSNLTFSDDIHLKGHLTLSALYEDGRMTTLVDDKNLIVLSGRSSLVEFLVGTNSILSGSINGVAFGDDGVLPTNHAIAKVVLPTDLGVNRAITPLSGNPLSRNIDYTFNIRTSSLTSTPKVVVSITIPRVPVGFQGTSVEASSAGMNGSSLSELALMMTNGKAFSIKRFPAILKSPDFSIVISWEIFA